MAEIGYIVRYSINGDNNRKYRSITIYDDEQKIVKAGKLDIDAIKGKIAARNKIEEADVKVMPTKIAVRKVRHAIEEVKLIVFEGDEIANDNIRIVKYCDVLSIRENVISIIAIGIGMFKRDISDLENDVENTFFELELTLKDDKEDGIETWMKEIARIFYEEINQRKNETDKKTVKEEPKAKKSEDTEKNKFDFEVTEFKKFFEDTEYADKVSVQQVRKYFQKENVTEANFGRTDKTVRKGGSTKKVIRFCIKELKEFYEK